MDTITAPDFVTIVLGRHTDYDHRTGHITGKGKSLLDKVAADLVALNLIPGKIFSSEKIRGLETSSYLANTITKIAPCQESQIIPVSPLKPLTLGCSVTESWCEEILQGIKSLPDSIRVCGLVTHEAQTCVLGNMWNIEGQVPNFVAEFTALQLRASRFSDLSLNSQWGFEQERINAFRIKIKQPTPPDNRNTATPSGSHGLFFKATRAIRSLLKPQH